jgi:two-component system response regulator (stage 0 sporulation protein F)
MANLEHAGPTLRQPRLLVADDDEDLRKLLKDLFVEEGYDVIDAAGGSRALEILSSAADGSTLPFDVILLDFVMPGLSGLGVLGVMRRFARSPPTIIMTGFPDRSVEAFARNLGAVCVLRKPIDTSKLRDVVRRYVPHG